MRTQGRIRQAEDNRLRRDGGGTGMGWRGGGRGGEGGGVGSEKSKIRRSRVKGGGTQGPAPPLPII